MIVITGASKGIGKYLFYEFMKSGEEVIGTYNSTSIHADVAKNMYRVDISDNKQVQDWIAVIQKKINHITLINCAGVNYTSFAHKADVVEWSKVIKVNLIGTFQIIHGVLPIMRAEGYGRIINLSSVVAQTPTPGASAYAASKSGLWGLAKSIAVENSKNGITINNLNLGYFNIGMISEVREDYKEVIRTKIPTGEFGDPINIYKAIKYCQESDYINGASLDINGGLF